MSQLPQRFFTTSGLKSRSDETRLKAAHDLQKFVSTELRELPAEQYSSTLDEINSNIFSLVSSPEIHEKKGGIFAIVSLVGLEGGGNVNRLGRFANYLRSILPHPDVTLTEMTAKAIGQLALAEGAYTAEYVEFEVKKALEWIVGNEHKKLAAVLVLRELAVHTPTLFYQQIQQFFDNIFTAVRDPRPLIRERSVLALRACLRLTAQRESKEDVNSLNYQKTYDEAIGAFQEGTSRDSRGGLNRDDKIHGSLLMINELIMNSAWSEESVRHELTEREEHHDELSVIESLMAGAQNRHTALLGASTKDVIKSSLPRPSLMVRRFPGFAQGFAASKRTETKFLPSRVCQQFLNRNFDELCKLVLKYRTSKNALVHQTLLQLLPRIAALNQELFALNYLFEGVGYLQTCLRRERERAVALRSMGLMVYVLKDRMDLEPVLSTIKTNLPGVKDITTGKRQLRANTYEPAVFFCISMLARAVGPQVETEMKKLLDQMFSAGLSAELTSALKVLAQEIPNLHRDIQDGLLKILYMILLHQQMRHPGAPKSTPHALTPTASQGPPLETDIGSVTLALQTLGSFSFGAQPPLQLVQSCADYYLTSEHKSVRMEAVRTCASLLVPNLLPPTIFTTPFAPFSAASAQVVGEVLGKLLTVGITDPDDEIRECVFMSLDERFDPHLAQAENLTTLFVAVHDGVFRIRELGMCIIGRLSNLNPAFVMPTLRKVLIQILTELEYSGVGRNKEQSAKLLGHLIANAPKLVRPYQEAILKVLIPKLKEPDPNPSVTINIMAAIGELAQVARDDMRYCVDDLCPIIVEMLQDASSLAKREVALWTFGQLVESTGYVVEPYYTYPNILDILFNFLKVEQLVGIRREVIRVLGLLGALDPYKRKQHKRSGVRSKMGTPVSKPMDKKSGGTGSGDTASELLVSMGSGTNLEDFYPSVAINSLMRILKDQSLSQHHTMSIQALGFIFKSLGIKSVPYLPQVMPPFLSVMRTCDKNMREYLFKQLGQIISIIKQHARNYMPEIFGIIREFWSPNSPIQNTIILLIEKIVVAMGDELKVYIPRLVHPVLKLFLQDTSEQKLATQKMMSALQLCGASLDDYLHLLVPPIVKAMDASNPTDVRRTAMETIEKLSSTLDFTDYASQIIHALIQVLDQSQELRGAAMATLCAMVTQLGQRYKIFIPTVRKLMMKHRYSHPMYELLLSRLSKDEPLIPDDDVEKKAKRQQPDEDNSAEIEAASFKKFHMEVNALARAWSSVGRVRKEDWMEWLRRLGVELLKESPSPSLRSCWALAQAYNQLARELFNAAFVSCWMELRPVHQEDFVSNLKQALTLQNIPEITQTVLNLAEFMEHCEEATGRLPLTSELLGECAMNCRAYAKALHYKEEEFHRGLTTNTLESLISINNKLQQPDAAAGVLVFAQKKAEGEFKIQEEWYESLHNWDAAYSLYCDKSYLRPEDINLTLGRMRCLNAMGEWTKLYEIACESWGMGDDETRQKMSVMASASAWGLGQWESMEEYCKSIPKNTPIGAFFQALMGIHKRQFSAAQQCIDDAKDILDTELTALVGESYSRAYGVMVNIQLLSELEEIIHCLMDPDRKQQLRKIWWKRLLGCQRNVEDWQKILQVRSLVLTQQEEIQSWVKFASICRKSGKMALSERTLLSLLGNDPACSEGHLVSKKYPRVTFAYMKHLWQAGNRQQAFDLLSQFVMTHRKPLVGASDENDKLLARCYLKLGDWRTHLEEKNDLSSSTITTILQYYHKATEHDRCWYKAWHAWAYMNFQALLEYKQQPSGGGGALLAPSTPGDIGRSPSPTRDSASDEEYMVVTYACSAVQGFFKSIALSVDSSLQDTLRLLTLWFDYGHLQDVHKALMEGVRTIDIDTWLQVIPQLIARIDHPRSLVSKRIHDLLTSVGKQHPQALIYPLMVATKSQKEQRKHAAEMILSNMREHSSALVRQAIMVSEELIRVAILWHEQWHEGLEDASRLYFGEHNVPGMFGVLQPLHGMMENGPETLKEISFNHAYGRDLAEAYEWCKKYQSTNNVKDLTQAWELYYHVFRRISKQLPQLTTLELQYVSPNLLECEDLELAVPGTYEPNQPIIHIKKVSSSLNVITSKQRPRKLVIQGSNGQDFMFLLKGHEDLRQDERVMQLFGLVNTLLANDPETFKRHLSIERYSVIPLSPNSGLIGWVPHCDTIHSLIRDYREKKKIMLNIEHRLMLQMSSDYDHLMLMQKVEVFEQAIESTSGDDLAKVLWLKSPSSEVWFDRRTNYTRSLAVMSMVGYILGLGDRHPSNLMLDRLTGRILHIDFGDCFEVAMTREKFPEKIPFRLTRMLTNAMEVTGIEGNFRQTCNNVMRVLRENKDSVMAVLEAFVYDPLLNWRLIDETSSKTKNEARRSTRGQENALSPSRSSQRQDSQGYQPEELNKRAVAITQRVKQKLTETSSKTKNEARRSTRGQENALSPSRSSQRQDSQGYQPEELNKRAVAITQRVKQKLTETSSKTKNEARRSTRGQENALSPSRSSQRQDSQGYQPEELNKRAVAITQRVKQKLTGNDFQHESTLDVDKQVQLLIEQATSHENLCQCYIGWCPFW